MKVCLSRASVKNTSQGCPVRGQSNKNQGRDQLGFNSLASESKGRTYVNFSLLFKQLEAF